MIEILIDGQRADTSEKTYRLALDHDEQSAGSTEWGRQLFARGVELPLTPLNQKLLGDAHNPLGAEPFNSKQHTVEVLCDGSVVARGIVRMEEASVCPEGYYRFDIVGQDRSWAKSAQEPIAELPIDYQATLDGETIAESWSAPDALVRFLPIERGFRRERNSPQLPLGVIDYHPFINLRGLMRQICQSAGYKLQSEWFDSEWFGKLFISGRWAKSFDVEWAAQRCDFVALREEDSGFVEADYAGCVVADPLALNSTVGNFAGSVVASNRVAESSCGVDSNGVLCFAPPKRMRVAFEIVVEYETSIEVASRSRLRGFDRIELPDGVGLELPLPNNFHDRRPDYLDGEHSYHLFIFGPNEGVAYKLRCKQWHGADSSTIELLTTAQAVTQIPTEAEVVYSDFELVAVEGAAEIPAVVDWAIYDSYVAQQSTMLVRHTLLTSPIEVAPDKPLYFNTISFGGAAPSMRLNLRSGCSIRPLFVDIPPLGTVLHWGDVADLSMSGSELIGAIGAIFDLEFRTDTEQHIVGVEPRMLAKLGRVIDLTGRIDTTHPIVVGSPSEGVGQIVEIGYGGGDTLVDTLAQQEGHPYGLWRTALLNPLAECKVLTLSAKPLTPSVECSGSVGSAPSAKLIDVSGAAGEMAESWLNVNFAPKLLFYKGLAQLPVGQSWGWPTEGANRVPELLFHCPAKGDYDEDVSLLIEDRDGVVGLHRFRQKYVEMLNHSRRIELSAVLLPEEFEEITLADVASPRPLFDLLLQGDRVLCRLESIESYNPSDGVAKLNLLTIV